MIEIGRLCVKIAGRDAGNKCVVVDILDDKFVLIDGATRRRKCNILHLEPLNDVVKIAKNASHDEVSKAFKHLGIDAWHSKPKKAAERQKPKRKTPEQLRAQKEAKGKTKAPKPKKETKKEISLEAKASDEKAEKPAKKTSAKKK